MYNKEQLLAALLWLPEENCQWWTFPVGKCEAIALQRVSQHTGTRGKQAQQS
jgi:hypothetical protein